MTIRDHDPLFGDEQSEIPLTNAPLIRVVAQVRFAPVFMLRNRDFIAPFQEAIRKDYPQSAQERAAIFLPFAIESEKSHEEIFWRFYSAKKDWRVSISQDFLALETQKYVSRSDFVQRLRAVVGSLMGVVGSVSVTRIGIRYVDHVKQPEFEAMATMLRPEMLGVSATRLEQKLQHAVSEAVYEVKEGSLLSRWGVLSAHGSHDPEVLQPVPDRSWFLDLDVFSELREPLEMNAEVIHDRVLALAARAYSFFRWVVTDDFLATYGAA